jgi:hypothetical protein
VREYIYIYTDIQTTLFLSAILRIVHPGTFSVAVVRGRLITSCRSINTHPFNNEKRGIKVTSRHDNNRQKQTHVDVGTTKDENESEKG